MGILTLTTFMNSEKTDPEKLRAGRYNTQDAILSWKPGFWMAAQGDI